MTPELSVIIVSYNTREMTLKAIETLYEHASDIAMQVILWDNASADGSADAVAERFPQVELHRCPDNLGFAAGNNRAAETATGEWLLLLNSDTETLPGAIQNLLAFAKANPQAGIVGGRTLFGDGSLNATSCFNRMTVWSLFCYSTYLSQIFKGNPLFDTERVTGSMMDEVRQVDVVTGCFFLLKTELWRELGGFDLRYFMYAEETDLCLRAGKLGYRPMVTPAATIIHHGGASAISSATKQLQSYRGKATIVRDHFGALRKRAALALLWFTAFNRNAAYALFGLLGKGGSKRDMWREVWNSRRNWLQGY
ncbi:glycosyltransferase family 2 protein [Erythrobacter donghaensis]|uniref:glycosyltransferase family 2 protein n=1 Tax=Erythrobacter donghaensis TaxID=267135 RepID=UPI000A3BA6D6|nr:glycosyltransferase family 2 protein [Erythrobacter donghaensis]